MHKRYDKDIKAKVALEALRGEKTLQEIATMHSVHPNLVSQWKKQLLENAGALFEKSGKEKAVAEEIERKQDMLFRQIGQLQVENDFLKKSTNNCTGPNRRFALPRDSSISFPMSHFIPVFYFRRSVFYHYSIWNPYTSLILYTGTFLTDSMSPGKVLN
jgi:transposase-like protein